MSKVIPLLLMPLQAAMAHKQLRARPRRQEVRTTQDLRFNMMRVLGFISEPSSRAPKLLQSSARVEKMLHSFVKCPVRNVQSAIIKRVQLRGYLQSVDLLMR